MGDIGLYVVTTQELPILFTAAGYLVKNMSNSAPCHASKLSTNEKTFLGEMRPVFIDHCTDPASDFVEFLNTFVCHIRTTSISLLQGFFSYTRLYRYDPMDRKEAWKALSECCKRRIIQIVQKFFSYSDSAHPEELLVGKTANKIPRAIGKSARRFLRDDSDE